MRITLYNQIDKIIEKALKPQFMTSLEAINKVMNIPECALKAILRDNGCDAVETKSICIDEEMLMVFADAYIRKLRSYFISSNRNRHLLTPQESCDLEEFYITFKKKEVEHTNVKNWNHIDTDLIRDYFVQEVKEQTPNYRSFYKDYIGCVIINERNTNPFQIAEYTQPKKHYSRSRKHQLLVRITKSRFYRSKLRASNRIYHCPTIIRQVYITARYHIFPVENKESDEYNKAFISKEIYTLLLTASSETLIRHVSLVH